MPCARFLVRCLSVGLLGILAGCMAAKTAPPPPPPPQVTVISPVEFPVQSYLEYNGNLDAIKAVEIRARVKGILTDVMFVEGEEVTKGTPLYKIDKREYNTAIAKSTAELKEAEGDILNWKAQIKLAESDLERLTRAMSASPQSEIDKSRATLDVNKARLAVAEATRDAKAAALHTTEILLGYTDIVAPIDGRINRTMVTEGNLVGQSETTLLTTIVGVDELYVDFDAPERDYFHGQRMAGETDIPDASSRKWPIEVGVATEHGYPHPGFIDFQENRVDPGTGTIRIRGRINNPPVGKNLKRLLAPGMYARVRIPFGLPNNHLVIPEECLMTGQEGRYVFVIGDKDVVEKRLVTVGENVWRSPPREDKNAPRWTVKNPKPAGEPKPGMPPAPTAFPLLSVTSIEKGLKPGDRVIVNGLQKVRPGQPAAPDLWDFKAPAEAK